MVGGLTEVEELPSHANGRKGLGLSPAQRDARSSVQSAVAHFPPARPPTGWRQVPIKPPEDLPPFQPEAKALAEQNAKAATEGGTGAFDWGAAKEQTMRQLEATIKAARRAERG